MTLPYVYILAYDVETLTTGIYNSYGELQPDDVQPVTPSMTPEEALGLVRDERTRRLYDCDWTQLPDTPLSPEQVEQWQIYRQELRDLPNVLVWNETIWPTKPI